MKVLFFLAIAIVIAFVFWTQNEQDSLSPETVSKQPPPHASSTANSEPQSDSKEHSQDNDEAKTRNVATSDSNREKNNLSRAITSESEFERRYPGKWRFRKRDGNSIQSITGGLIPEVGKNKESVLKFAQELSPLLAEGRFDLANEARVFASTERLNSYQIDQFAEGFQVYQGSMQVIARAQDGSAYIVNNQLKDIQPFNNSPSISANQALALVQKKYASATLKAPDIPLVFSSGQHGTRLAWVIDLTVTEPKHSHRDIVVAADNGEILYEEEFVIHD